MMNIAPDIGKSNAAFAERRLVTLLFALVGSCFFCGCAIQKQTQFFAATDPDTGATNYYKMTISGSGGGGVDYHWQAGYFSAAAVDVLRGTMPDIPTLDLPVDQLEKYNAVADNLYDRLVAESAKYACGEASASGGEPSGGASEEGADAVVASAGDSSDSSQACSRDLTNEDFIAMSRLLWFSSLSKSDIASVGMTQNLDPFQFRKLVFWTTASNIDLQEFAGEIDSVINSAEGIVENARARAASRKKSGKKRLQALDKAIDLLPDTLDPAVKDLLKSFLNTGSGD